MKTTDKLTAEQELTLIKQLPDKRVLDKLVTHNLGLVHKVCHRFPLKNAVCTYDDLFQEGVAGLIHGINKYDYTRGYRLSTYVYRWVQAYVSRYFQNHGKTIRIPVHMSDTSIRMRKEVETLTKKLGHMPTSTECMTHIPDYENMLVATRDTFSLNQLLSEDGELMELAGDDTTGETDDALTVELLLDQLREHVSERDYDILTRRYGLEGQPEHTLSELADRYGITRARAHQIERECLNTLRAIQTA